MSLANGSIRRTWMSSTSRCAHVFHRRHQSRMYAASARSGIVHRIRAFVLRSAPGMSLGRKPRKQKTLGDIGRLDWLIAKGQRWVKDTTALRRSARYPRWPMPSRVLLASVWLGTVLSQLGIAPYSPSLEEYPYLRKRIYSLSWMHAQGSALTALTALVATQIPGMRGRSPAVAASVGMACFGAVLATYAWSAYAPSLPKWWLHNAALGMGIGLLWATGLPLVSAPLMAVAVAQFNQAVVLKVSPRTAPASVIEVYHQTTNAIGVLCLTTFMLLQGRRRWSHVSWLWRALAAALTMEVAFHGASVSSPSEVYAYCMADPKRWNAAEAAVSSIGGSVVTDTVLEWCAPDGMAWWAVRNATERRGLDMAAVYALAWGPDGMEGLQDENAAVRTARGLTQPLDETLDPQKQRFLPEMKELLEESERARLGVFSSPERADLWNHVHDTVQESLQDLQQDNDPSSWLRRSLWLHHVQGVQQQFDRWQLDALKRERASESQSVAVYDDFGEAQPQINEEVTYVLPTVIPDPPMPWHPVSALLGPVIVEDVGESRVLTYSVWKDLTPPQQLDLLRIMWEDRREKSVSFEQFEKAFLKSRDDGEPLTIPRHLW